jgi:hypothetical protein
MQRKENTVARQIGHVAVTRFTTKHVKALLCDTTSYCLLPGHNVAPSDVVSGAA